jgi:signal transduction histidine kinase
MDEPSTAGHVVRSERLLLRAAVLFRIGGLLQIGGSLLTVTGQYHDLLASLSLAGAVGIESLLMVVLWFRHRRVAPAPLTVDVLFCAAALAVNGTLSTGPSGHSWVFFMYPFTIISVVAIGVGYPMLWQACAGLGLLVGTYLATSTRIFHDPLWNVAPNTLAYVANGLITWFVARELRHYAALADRQEAEALDRTAELAREREATRYARMLHDRVLQTMETLAGGEWVTDLDIRHQVMSEAVWLRGLVTSGPDPAAGLAAGLRAIASEQAERGTAVELNDTVLQRIDPAAVPPSVVEAICGAVREAVTNVAKHAGVDRAVVRAGLDGTGTVLRISIVDQGRGFDPAAVVGGRSTGLAASIRDRIELVGGIVVVTSAPGIGTDVELRIPMQARPEGRPPAP